VLFFPARPHRAGPAYDLPRKTPFANDKGRASMSREKSEPMPRSRISLASRVLGSAVRGTVAAVSQPVDAWRNKKPVGKNQVKR
jgi:hypothetical protein